MQVGSMMEKTGIIIQARMTSTRLPGKVMMKVMGRPLLDYQLERIRRVRNADLFVVATTNNRTDDIISEYCKKNEVNVFRGSEHDVLSRYFQAAMEYSIDNIVRVTADCPVIDPKLIEDLIACFTNKRRESVDYVSNILERTYPRGMDCEIFSFNVLKMINEEALDDYSREHVTPYIYNNRDKFRVMGIKGDVNYSGYRWTVDTPEDFSFIKAMLEYLYPLKNNFTLMDGIHYMNLSNSM